MVGKGLQTRRTTGKIVEGDLQARFDIPKTVYTSMETKTMNFGVWAEAGIVKELS